MRISGRKVYFCEIIDPNLLLGTQKIHKIMGMELKYLESIRDRLIKAVNNTDTEVAHIDADDCLCDLLIELGYSDIVDLWVQVMKWYA